MTWTISVRHRQDTHRAAARALESRRVNVGPRRRRVASVVAASALVAASVLAAGVATAAPTGAVGGSVSAGAVLGPASTPTGQRTVATVHVGGPLTLMALDSAGHLLYALEDSPRMAVINTRTRRVVRVVKLPGGTGPGAVIVDPATRRVYVTCADGTLRVFTPGATRQVARLHVGEGSFGIAVDAPAHRVYVTSEDPLPAVTVVDTTRERVVDRLHLRDGGSRVISPDSVAVDPSRHALYVAGGVEGGAVLAIADTRTERVRARVRLHDAFDVVVNPVTHAAYVTNRRQGTVTVVSGRTARVVRVIRGVHGAAELAVDAAHQAVYVGNLDDNLTGRTVSVINAGSARLVRAFPVPRLPSGIVVDPRTGLLYVASLATGAVTVIRVDYPTRTAAR